MKKIFIWLFMMFLCASAWAEVSHDTVTQYYVLRVPEEGSMDWTKTISDDFVSIDSALHNISNDIANGRVSHDIELSSYSIDGDGFVRIDSRNNANNDFILSTTSSGGISVISADGADFIITRANATTANGKPVFYYGGNYNYNTVIGDVEDNNLTDGLYANFYNVVIGYKTGQAFETGSYNILIGGAYNNTGFSRYGSNNVALGYSALEADSYGEDQVAIGYSAGANHRKGYGNVFIGRQAGQQNQNSCRGIYIGYQSGLYESGSSMLYINDDWSFDPIIKGNMSSDTLWFNSTVIVSKDVLTPHISSDIISTDVIAAKYGVITVDATRVKLTDLKGRNFTADAMTCDIISSERVYFQSRPPATSPDLPATGRGVLYMSQDGTLKFGSVAGGWHEVLGGLQTK